MPTSSYPLLLNCESVTLVATVASLMMSLSVLLTVLLLRLCSVIFAAYSNSVLSSRVPNKNTSAE